MKKKYVLVLTVLIACLTLSLTACSEGGRDYSGSCEIIYKVGEEYEDVVVSCASADISKVDETTYKVSLESTAPVEVILSATGYANKVYRYSSSQLKKGSITETVTFDEVTFVCKIIITAYDGENIEPIVKTEGVGIRKTQTTGEYELLSKKPITSDVVISADGYYDYTILSGSLQYVMGEHGVADSDVVLIKKDSNEVLISTNLQGYQYVEIIRASDNQIAGNVGADKKVIEVDDYFFQYNGIYEFISKNELINGYYYYNLNKTQIIISDIGELDIISVELNGDVVYCDEEYSCIYHRQPLEVGQLIKIEVSQQEQRKYYVGNITEQMVENGKIDFADLVVDTESWQHNEIEFDIRFISPNGVVDMASGVVSVMMSDWVNRREYGVNDKIKFSEKDDSYIRIENLVDKQGKKYRLANEYDIENRVREQSNVKGSSLTVDIFVKPQVDFTIKYVDLSGKLITTEQKRESANTRSYLHLSGYKIVGANSIVVSEMLDGKTISVQVVKAYKITIKAEGFNVDGRYFSSTSGDQIYFNNGEGGLTIDETMLGTTLYYKFEGYQEASYYFFLNIPDEIKDRQTITVTIQALEDEWA